LTPERSPRLLVAAPNLFDLVVHHGHVIAGLAEAGVEVRVRYGSEDQLTAAGFQERLRGSDVDVRPLPPDLKPSRRHRPRGDLLAFRLRQLANLLRYYHPDYRQRQWLREWWASRAPDVPGTWAARIGRLGGRACLITVRGVSVVDRLLPPAQSARALLAAERPDAVAAVGVVRNPELVELLKAAAEARLPSATWVQSWDHLSTKGLLHFVPDRVFVWNEVQRDELRRYHGIPPERASITGAQSFDYWFDGREPAARDVFCRDYGLDPDRPIVVYLSSSRLGEPDLDTFFLPWLRALRSSGDPVLETASVLVRPHPMDARHWARLRPPDPGVVVSRSATHDPVHGETFRKRYRDELHHACVAVGINTSAMIEAAIAGKPVCTVELPEVADRQRGTVHFEYLTTAGGGLLRTAASFEEHVADLRELIRRDPYERDAKSTRFVEAFVRPHGLEVAPGKVFVDEMLRLLAAGASTVPTRAAPARALGRLIHRAAPVVGAPLLGRRRTKPASARLRERVR
jgi:hypothetical protein